MITPQLEALIQKGKATQVTYVFGAGGVGRIPVPQNSFIIIHHWDYWHFIDTPEGTQASPATATISWFVPADTPPFPVTFDFGIIGNFVVNVDINDLPGTLALVLAAWVAIMPGGTVNGGIDPVTGFVNFTFITSSPGTIWNGQPATMTPVDPIPPVGWVTVPGVFDRGADAVALTLNQFLQHKIHQLEFRSNKSINHFLIDEPVEIFPQHAEVTDPLFFANLGGVYKKDCYLVHNEAVQINVLGVPPVSQWLVDYNPLTAKSQEFAVPVGYGIGVLPTVRNILFDGVTQHYMPLTEKFEDPAGFPPNQYREQFMVDANAANILFNPQNVSGVRGNFRTYPLINIDYIQVDMNYNEFVKGSN